MIFIKTLRKPIGIFRAILSSEQEIEPFRQNRPPDEDDVDAAERAAETLEELGFAMGQRSPSSRSIYFPRFQATNPATSGPGGFVVLHRIGLWLQAPISASEVPPWRRLIRWLKAPVGS